MEQRKQEAEAFSKNHPLQNAANEGIKEFLNGQSTPANLAMLAALPESKLITAFFAAQAARGTYKSAEDAYQAQHYAESHTEVKNLFGAQPFNVMPIAWTIKRGNVELLNFMNTVISLKPCARSWL